MDWLASLLVCIDFTSDDEKLISVPRHDIGGRILGMAFPRMC